VVGERRRVSAVRIEAVAVDAAAMVVSEVCDK
jgi:hypothetical protein